jgi:hypothetical protein
LEGKIVRKFYFLVTFLAALGLGEEAHAAMGLKCSQWLDARAYMRIDPRTGRMVDDRPRTVPPVPADIDALAAQANWYLAGRVTTLMWLDRALGEVATQAGVPAEKASTADILAGLMQVDTLCRNGLQKDRRDNDVADMIDLQQMDALTRRTQELHGIIHKLIEVGREKGGKW